MLRFVGVRLLQSLAALAILSVVVFILARATGDPLHMILPMSATAEDYANARAYLGLDRPYLEQYLSFVGKAPLVPAVEQVIEQACTSGVRQELCPITH